MPARVLMQDFTGVPAVVDLAAMRDAMQAMGGDAKRVNPLLPAELVIDHSVIVDEFGTPTAFQVNADLELQRNRERYALLRWAQQTFRGRSEEHTSELQSPCNLVCRLLLEKKKHNIDMCTCD